MSFPMIRPNLDDLPELESEVPEGFSLRTYRPGDEVAWCRMMEGAIGTDWTYEKFKAKMLDQPQFHPEGLFFVVWDGPANAPEEGPPPSPGEPAGTACAWKLEETWGPETGVVHMVAVDPRFRGRRLGRVASLAVLHHFRKQGLKRAVLNTSEKRLPAVRTYLGLGFIPVLRTPEAKKGWEQVEQELNLHVEPYSEP